MTTGVEANNRRLVRLRNRKSYLAVEVHTFTYEQIEIINSEHMNEKKIWLTFNNGLLQWGSLIINN